MSINRYLYVLIRSLLSVDRASNFTLEHANNRFCKAPVNKQRMTHALSLIEMATNK